MSKHNYPSKYIHYFKENLGINLMADERQREYVESIIAPIEEVKAVFCDSDAGTGKTFLAVQTAYQMYESGEISKIIYVRNALGLRDQGFLPGELEQKEYHYMRPLIDSLNKYGQEIFEKLIKAKAIECSTTTFLRGVNYGEKAVLIIDEAQNFDLNELQTILTRPEELVKVVVIGSSKQVDDKYIKRYGKEKLIPFQVYQRHFELNKEVKTKNIKLKTNYRGPFSAYADNILLTVRALEAETTYDMYQLKKMNEEQIETFHKNNP